MLLVGMEIEFVNVIVVTVVVYTVMLVGEKVAG